MNLLKKFFSVNYENIGDKLKWLSNLLRIITMLLFFAGALVVFVLAFVWKTYTLILAAIAIVFIAPLISWVCHASLYILGEVIQSFTDVADYSSIISKYSKEFVLEYKKTVENNTGTSNGRSQEAPQEESLNTDAIDEEPVKDIETKYVISPDEGVTTIPYGAYMGRKFIENIEIIYGFTKIEDKAFMNCVNLKSITIPKSIKRISPYAFSECLKLTNINYSGTMNQWLELTDNKKSYFHNTGNYIVHCNNGDLLK